MRGEIIKLKVYIDLKKIRSNIMRLRESAQGAKFMLMVKADAYGHGLKEVAAATEDIVDAFGVATVDEGAELREFGIKKPVLTLTCAPSEMKYAIDNKLTVSLSDLSQLAALEELVEAGAVRPDRVLLHIALDSGMHRFGFSPRRIDGVIARLNAIGVKARGIYSHLRAKSIAQIECFEKVCKKVRAAYPNAIRHLASSHYMDSKRLRYDMVRAGISAYEGAMTVESEVMLSRRVKTGEFVSYGDFKVENDANTAVVFGGYADGAARENPSPIYIRGRACEVLGRVCMDCCVVDCGDFLPAVGEKAVLLDAAKAEEIAKARKSVGYTLMTCWHGRIERIYDDDKGGSEAVGEERDSADERG